MLRGIVHDPAVAGLGGVAGHAGLFATADDLAIFAQTLLNGGLGPNGRRVLSPLAVRTMIDAAPDTAEPAPRAGLGRANGQSCPAGRPVRSHQLRTHRLHRHESLDRSGDRDVRHHSDQPAASRRSRSVADGAPLRGRDAGRRRDRRCLLPAGPGRRRMRARSTRRRSRPAPQAADGHDRRPSRPMRDRRPGRGGLPALAQQEGRAGHQSHRPDSRRGLDHRRPVPAPGVKLVKLFSPEHGIRGEVDAAVPDSKDETTGLPIVSLYGRNRKPLPEGPRGDRHPGLRHPGHRGSVLYLHHHARPGARGGQGRGQDRPGPRPTQPDRRPRGLRPAPRRGVRLVHRLPCPARPPRDDGRRAGPAL